MLEVRNVRKSYSTGDFTQVALDNVSITFRDNEFVAILGPSGSGKTTLLNIVGGLDHYDSGNLVIDGVETSAYRDRDWDTYRNNRIGFVFQSYNLIPHQTVLANVELALTLSGVSRSERRVRAMQALEEVGLADHVNKKPSQLSGGQMQRVAIARALINDPEIVLADEPTGALDSQTSEQIMDLLTQIAQDRLVVMVTHNPELAEEYATRIVSLKDGHISSDSNPVILDTETLNASDQSSRKTSMSFLTAIALSFNNLMTKKGRTLMTAFAGSIGIIGIAAILALANGVNNYIKSIEEDTLSVYPLSIRNQGLDLTSLMATATDMGDSDSDANEGEVTEIQMAAKMFDSIGSNDLAALKQFLDADGDGIDQYTNAIQYSYNVTPQIYVKSPSNAIRKVNPDSSFASLGIGGAGSASFMSEAMSTSVFYPLVDDTSVVSAQYDVVAGDWPSEPDEVLVVLTSSGGMSDFMMYAMGLRDGAELDAMVKQMVNKDPVEVPEVGAPLSYEDVMGVSFTLVNSADYFEYDPTYKVWTDKSADEEYVNNLVEKGETLRVSGIVKAKEGVTATALSPGIYYTSALTHHLIKQSAQTPIVKQQLAHPRINVFTGRSFADEEANPARENFDMSSLMTIDEDAIANAFTFDESALSIDTSALEFSMPNLTLDPASLPELKMEDLFSSMDLGDMAGAIDTDKILASLDFEAAAQGIDISETDQAAISDASQALLEGYTAYCASQVTGGPACLLDPATNFPLYLETPEGQELLKGAEDAAAPIIADLESAGGILVDQLVASISQQISQQLQTRSAAMASQMQAAMSQYMSQAMEAISSQISSQLVPALESQIGGAMEQTMGQLAANMSSAMGIDEEAFQAAFSFNMDEKQLAELMASMMVTEPASLDTNLAKLNYADLAKPSNIDIYPKDFEGKGKIIEILDDYNAQMESSGDDDKVITYTDIVGTLMSSVTTIVNVTSYVLVAFVAISLVVSSIMIGVITYISVLERKKEIGILRSIGASKRDIRRVFNAETLIVGFVAGAIGILVTLLMTIPANTIVYAKFGIANVAQLPFAAGAILIAVSMGLTFLAGLIPSSAASRRDPVEALRSE